MRRWRQPPTRGGGRARGPALGGDRRHRAWRPGASSPASSRSIPSATRSATPSAATRTTCAATSATDLGGVALLYALIAIHTFVWYPAEIVDAAAGLRLRLLAGLRDGDDRLGRCRASPPTRSAARRRVRCSTASSARSASAGSSARSSDGGVTLLLAARLVPIVPFSLFSYVAGRRARAGRPLRVDHRDRLHPDHRRHRSTSAPGSRSSRSTDPLLWASVAALLGLLLLTRLAAPRSIDQPLRTPSTEADS